MTALRKLLEPVVVVDPFEKDLLVNLGLRTRIVDVVYVDGQQ